MKYLLYGTSFVALLLAAPTFAQDQTNQTNQTSQPGEGQVSGDQATSDDEVVVLSQWNYAPLYETGWSVERLIDETDVYGPDGDEIGNVENVIFSNDGEVLAVIAEVGGFWDIGDTHVSVPWGEVEFAQDISRITVPVTEETADDYTVLGDDTILREQKTEEVATVDDDLATGENVFKATDLIGDYAYLSENVRYGYVNDLLVSDGKIQAVIVDASGYGRPGYYAYPYNGYGVAPPMGPRYDLPYGEQEIDVIENFDYDQLARGSTS